MYLLIHDSSDIVRLILEAANGGATKTKIMYKSYLSFAQLRDYLRCCRNKVWLNMRNLVIGSKLQLKV
ncbi:MAG: winged helix-turn-helix domain-containing protein [Nitrososphaeraceae archaeon]